MKLVALAMVTMLGAGCDLLKGGDKTASMTKIEYYFVAPLPVGQTPQDNPVDRMQTRFSGAEQAVVLYYDTDRTCEHYELIEVTAIADLQVKTGGPDAQTCERDQPHASSLDVPYTNSGGRGTLSLPMTDDAWAGSTTGGCGTWATAMCNRILQLTPPTDPVTKDEWNMIATGINQKATGGSSINDRAQYYKKQGGYCVHATRFNGAIADYQEIAQNIDRCDIKLSYFHKEADGELTHGHVETVTSVDYPNRSVTTNSWGFQATVTGGSAGGFDHSRDGSDVGMLRAFHAADGSKLWPASSTEVWVESVCPCNTFGGAASFLDTATL